jgi:hypothetical protein
VVDITDPQLTVYQTQGFKKAASANIIHKSESSADLGFRPNVEGANPWNRGADQCLSGPHIPFE